MPMIVMEWSPIEYEALVVRQSLGTQIKVDLWSSQEIKFILVSILTRSLTDNESNSSDQRDSSSSEDERNYKAFRIYR